jgi:hypothetical protein
MKRIDQFINFHRDEMDLFEPDEGHFIRFQSKLNKSKRFSMKWILRIAAVLIIAFFIAENINRLRSKNEWDLSLELKETAWFYNSRSEKLISEIQTNKLLNSNEKQNIMNDITDFDKEYKIILIDLKKFPDDERLVNAFIEYHKVRSEFLEEVLNQITQTNLISI